MGSSSIDVISSKTGPSWRERKKKRVTACGQMCAYGGGGGRMVGNCSLTADSRPPCKAAGAYWPSLLLPCYSALWSPEDIEEQDSSGLVGQ